MKEQVLKPRTRVEMVDPATAACYLSLNKNNRPLSQDTVLRYAEMMKRGEWTLVGDAIAIDTNGELRNGQHRLQAVVESGVPCQFLILENADPDSFPAYDCGRRRTASQIFAMKEIPNYCSVSSIVNKVLTLRGGNTGKHNARGQKSNQQMLDEYYSDVEGYRRADRLAASLYTNSRSFGQSALGAYIYILEHDLHHPAVKVEYFFKSVFSMKSSENPMLEMFRIRLIEDMASQKKMQPLYRFALLVKCWNAYVEGKRLKCLKWLESEEIPSFQ